ncbi:MAG: DNA polymerase III subunit beta [Alphaproteobacteria bacterium]|nr:DNA polymerase III subunit beta [Alphaproteobacteria bacterium]
MRRTELVAILAREAEAIRRQGVERLYIFGSFSRDEAGPESDVDIFVDPAPSARFSLFDRMALAERISDLVGRRADVFTRRNLHRTLRSRIESEAIRVF